jgi:AcrR family transcriptional regulator
MNASSDPERRQRLRERLRSATQAAILQAAEEVFLETGMDAARMESIAARAGVAVGTLYNYFEDREALVGALVQDRRAALLTRLDAALARAAALPFEEALDSFLQALFDHWSAHRSILSQASEAGRSGRGRSAVIGELVRRAESVLAAGRSAGRLRPDEDGVQAALLVGMVRGLIVKDFATGDESLAANGPRLVAEAFLRGSGI